MGKTQPSRPKPPQSHPKKTPCDGTTHKEPRLGFKPNTKIKKHRPRPNCHLSLDHGIHGIIGHGSHRKNQMHNNLSHHWQMSNT
jgi:hypothetical protein